MLLNTLRVRLLSDDLTVVNKVLETQNSKFWRYHVITNRSDIADISTLT